MRSLTRSFNKELDRNKDGYLDKVRLFVASFVIPFVFISLTFQMKRGYLSLIVGDENEVIVDHNIKRHQRKMVHSI